jgi:hypothetical protein
MEPVSESRAVELLRRTESLAEKWREKVPRRNQVNWQGGEEYAEWLECVRGCSVADLIEAARRLSPRSDLREEAEASQHAILADIQAKNAAHIAGTMTRLSRRRVRRTSTVVVHSRSDGRPKSLGR